MRPDRVRPAAPRPRPPELVYDVLVRYLRWTGLEVRLVSNITDIDDQIINRANAEGRPWQEITTKCEAVWFDAQARLGVARPDDTPHATEYVDEMVAMIGQLVEIGRAYTTDDGVYLSVETVEDYGLLAHQSLDDMLAGGGEREVVGAEQKRHPADFVLWKLAKPGEPSWPSPWGEGRPGWHSECVVMSLDLLGEGFDLHCGGEDLRFPHHENERAQAVALGKRFANHWMHHAFVVDAEGEKMSKSLGNVDNLLDLLDRYDDAHATACCCCRATTAARCASAPRTSQAAETTRSPASTRSPPAARGRRPTRRAPTPTCWPRSARRWTTTSTRRRRWPCCSTPCAGPTSPSTPVTPAAGALVAAVREIAGAVGLELGRGRRRPGRGRSSRRRRSTPRGRPRTTPPPTRSAPSCRPTAGSSRRRRPGPPSGGDRGLARSS